MRKLLTKIIQLLDGTPAVYGKRQSGQSVVELALITPILIILLAGLVEIGWFANNYLNLLDVTRAGARRGAVLQDQKSPLFWDNTYSYVPTFLLSDDPGEAAYQMPNSAANGSEVERFRYRWFPDDRFLVFSPDIFGPFACDTDYVSDRTFYSEIICTMETTMDPLVLNYDNGIDDIIVSGFAMQLVDPTGNSDWLAPYPGRAIDSDDPQVVVAGRYPTNANECNVYINSSGAVQVSEIVASLAQYRDPFDINRSGDRDFTTLGDDYTELEGWDAVAGSETDAEKQIGFSLWGNHKIADTLCVGSEWTMREIEDLMNLSEYDLTSNDERLGMPSQGVVIVEMFWEHEMLLKIPVLSPVFTVVGNEDGRMVINIWAAFPLSSVEPHIIFP